MDIQASYLHEKVAYFSQVRALSRDADEDEDEDEPSEVLDRERRARFFKATPVVQEIGEKESIRNLQCENEHPQQQQPAMPTTTVIRATQSPDLIRRKSHLAQVLDADGTIVPETSRASVKLQKRHTTSLPVAEQSPSLNISLSRKRKRDPVTLRPEAELIFRGLSFYYIPDNDVAPARRLRINKAREYGALWTRDVKSATHIIVDRGITYKDVGRIASGTTEIKVVNEDYPIDCIRFRSVLEAGQKKYLVPGQPACGGGEASRLPEDEHGEDRSAESTRSLQLKPQHRDVKRWDYVPDLGTPMRSEDGGGTETPTTAGKDEKGELGDGAAVGDVDDELSQYIAMMQEFKNLPLELDDEEDALSRADQVDVSSEDEQQKGHINAGKKQPQSGNKVLTFEDRFACNHAGEQDAHLNNPNSRTIEILQKMADYYDRISDHWRSMGYRKAITTLKRQTDKITTEEQAFKLPHVGRRLAQKIEEIVTTDKLQRLAYAEKEPMHSALQLFLRIYGVGTRQAQQWISQGYRTLEDLTARAKLNSNQRVGVEHYDDLNTRIPRGEVEALGAVVRRAASRIDPRVELIIGGSYRRGAESSHDIDFILTRVGTDSVGELRPFLGELVRSLERDGFITAHLASFRAGGDGSTWHGCCVLPQTEEVPGNSGQGHWPIWRRIDILLVPESQMGGALIYFTGNDIFNRSMRLLASKKGMRLNQRGLYEGASGGGGREHRGEGPGQLLEGRDERRIFEILGVKWREPLERWC